MTTKAMRSSERGQSMVELALLLPFLLVLVLGVVDLGMGFRTYIGLTGAAREGVRWASIHPAGGSAQAVARATAEAGRIGLSGADIQVSVTPDRSAYSAGEHVTVTIRHDYPLMFGFFTALPDVPFRAQATMVVLYDS